MFSVVQSKKLTMRVIMFPGVGVQNENRYIDILVSGLTAAGVEVVPWKKHLSFQHGDIFHVHWPEIISEIRERKYNLLRGEWISRQFFATIKRVKRHKGALIYTVHDLQPHDPILRDKPFRLDFMKRFLSEVDVAIALTADGIPQIKTALPELANKRFHVGHHAHYRQFLGDRGYNLEARASLGINTAQRTFSFIGSLRPNKRPDLVVEAFKHLPLDTNFLIVAGAPNAAVASSINGHLEGARNIYSDLTRISEKEVERLYSVTDILVFPGTDYFNSGTIYTALSLNVPVLAAWSPTNAEIQRLVGTQWLHLYQGDFTSAVMEQAKVSLVQRQDGNVCDLAAFDPNKCADEVISGYREALASRTS